MLIYLQMLESPEENSILEQINAATEADQAIRDSLPAPAKCEHKFSPLFQRKMCQAFRMVKHPVIYKLLRYAACFVLAAALASGTFFFEKIGRAHV